MNKLVLLIVALVALSVVSEAGFGSHSETKTILAALSKIEAKIRKSMVVDKSSLNTIHAQVKSTERLLKKQKDEETVVRKASGKKQKYAYGEMMLIRRIKQMLTSEYGSASHAAMSCQEVLKYREVEKGTFYIIKNGKPTRTYCSKSKLFKRKVVMWSGGCPSHNRGGGWQKLCLSGTRFVANTFERYIALHGNYWSAVKPGFYRITAWGMTHNNGWTYGNLQIYNKWNMGNHYNHAHSWSHKHSEYFYPMKQNEQMYVRMHSRGGNKYTWHNWGNGYNGVEIEYKGTSMSTYLGSCSGHNRSGKWVRYCLNQNVINSPKGAFSRATNGILTIRKAGYFRLNAFAMQHAGNCMRRGRIMVNGQLVSYGYMQANGGWSNQEIREVMKLNKNDKVWMEYSVDCGNKYNWHGGRHHSTLQFTYLGPDFTGMVAGCGKRASRSKSWRTYCLDTFRFNNLKDYVDVGSNGVVKFKRAGVYKIDWAGSMKASSNGWIWRYSRIMFNGKTLNYDHEYNQMWTTSRSTRTVKARAGNKFYISNYINQYGSQWGGYNEKQSALTVEFLGQLD